MENDDDDDDDDEFDHSLNFLNFQDQQIPKGRANFPANDGEDSVPRYTHALITPREPEENNLDFPGHCSLMKAISWCKNSVKKKENASLCPPEGTEPIIDDKKKRRIRNSFYRMRL